MHYETELKVALKAIRQAALLCENLSSRGLTPQKKGDASPVTVADYAAQIVITDNLATHFPKDGICAEETLAVFRESTPALQEAVRAECGPDIDLEAKLARNSSRGPSLGRVWIIDPIDGTKGFLRKEAYCCVLALMEGTRCVLSVIACPNLQAFSLEPTVYWAIAGAGAWSEPLGGGARRKLSVSKIGQVSEGFFTEASDSNRASKEAAEKVRTSLGNSKPPLVAEGQVKHVLIASGLASAYVRVPKLGFSGPDAIWDVAPGALLVVEAGGVATDRNGKSLDYSELPYLNHNSGMLLTNGLIHNSILFLTKNPA